jgi:cellulose synthase/poly-beta-1,6-N-acetylglucosamine synthase-like glycosyltransferase
LILRDQNGGKTAAVRSGLDVAQGDFVLFQDADMEYDPDDFRKLLRAVEGSSSVVFASPAIFLLENGAVKAAADGDETEAFVTNLQR